MYTVEVWHEGDALAKPMDQMRIWLDHKHIQPSVFRLSLLPGGTVFRLEFNILGEAEAVARAFAGQVIEDERACAVAA